VPANEENGGVNTDEDVEKRRQPEPLIGRYDDDKSNESGQDFQKPREEIARIDDRPDRNRQKDYEECNVKWLRSAWFVQCAQALLELMFWKIVPHGSIFLRL
jgi:hypothetical protein